MQNKVLHSLMPSSSSVLSTATHRFKAPVHNTYFLPRKFRLSAQVLQRDGYWLRCTRRLKLVHNLILDRRIRWCRHVIIIIYSSRHVNLECILLKIYPLLHSSCSSSSARFRGSSTFDSIRRNYANNWHIPCRGIAKAFFSTGLVALALTLAFSY